MLEKLNLLSEYKYYFQITINAYDNQIERNLPPKNAIIEAFQKLSEKIGKEKVIWRYDPIILTNNYNIDYHCKHFEFLASKLHDYTRRCIISFVDMYKKTERNLSDQSSLSDQSINIIDNKSMMEIGSRLSRIALNYNMKIESCSELIDLSEVGIEHTKCVDDKLISEIIGQNIIVGKDKNQRRMCGCVASIDIGSYNTCRHGCSYCYANYNDNEVLKNISKHDTQSPLMIGRLENGDKITNRKMESYVNKQLNMFSK
jgi:DNA repair photolyase